ncbi:---NA--- [Octopus vulgaris]|uniref:---NA n=1 Tax=Octopus vulgaris TaxID=6645 RepID=A0AA36F5G7_OCTVU|nr:---NA--- [Octopus vulgaris]
MESYVRSVKKLVTSGQKIRRLQMAQNNLTHNQDRSLNSCQMAVKGFKQDEDDADSSNVSSRSNNNSNHEFEGSVQVPLRNYDEFAESFDCSKGTYMNPGHKIKIWTINHRLLTITPDDMEGKQQNITITKSVYSKIIHVDMEGKQQNITITKSVYSKIIHVDMEENSKNTRRIV